MEKSKKNIASRGVDFQRGKLKEKIRAITSLIIPLFISSFQRSIDLANAMEARGYNPQAKRTKYRINKWHIRDTLSFTFIVLIFVGLVTLSATNFDLISWGINLLCA